MLIKRSCSLGAMILFGSPWRAADWRSSDDSVRGGKSHSHLTISPDNRTAIFNGTLDARTLRGAGFASQTTRTTNTTWDLSGYAGITIRYSNGDDLTYSLNLKDVLPETLPNGRYNSTVEWAYNITAKRNHIQPDNIVTTFIPWSYFKPIYRGRPFPSARPLALKHIRRFSIMARSFFDKQEGPFSLTLVSISATGDPKVKHLMSNGLLKRCIDD